MIKVKVIHNPKLNCFDEILATIARNEHRDFELFLSQAWGFVFLNSCNSALLGDRISPNSERDFDALSKYHGIRCEFIHSRKLTADLLGTLFLNNRYIFAAIDTYFCSWDKNYLKLHNPHHTIIIDAVSYESELVYITDPFYEKHYEPVSFNVFNKGVGEYGTVNITVPQIQIDCILVRNLLLQSTKKIRNDIVGVQNFACAMQDVDLDKETAGYENIWHSPIIFNMGRIALDRLAYSYMLEYLQREYSFALSDEILMLESVSDKWNRARSIIVKQ